MSKFVKVPTLAVILGGTRLIKSAVPEPIAHIIALKNGETVAERARPCLHVWATTDGCFEFADGILAVKNECFQIGNLVHWPVLGAALSKPTKDCNGLINHKENEPPYQRIKNLEEDGFSDHPLPSLGFHTPLLALRLAKQWNKWVSKKETRQSILCEMVGEAQWAKMQIAERESHTDSFRKYCKDIGFEHDKPTNVDEPWTKLVEILKTTSILALGINERLDI